jgi:hypothetical protein
MKRLIINTLLSTLFLSADVATDEIDNMITKIKAPRQGVDLKELSATLNPFVAINQNDVNETIVFAPKKKYTKMLLGGIMNKRAFINDAWYREGDNVSDYILKHIGRNGVVLVKDKQIKKLFLHEKQENIIIMKDGE